MLNVSQGRPLERVHEDLKTGHLVQVSNPDSYSEHDITWWCTLMAMKGLVLLATLVPASPWPEIFLEEKQIMSTS